MTTQEKIKEWVMRYGPPEIAGIIMVQAATQSIVLLTNNQLLAAFIAPWCENIVFYSIIAIRDVRARGTTLGVGQYLILLRSMFVEFGPAEYIDSCIIRPACLAYFPHIISSYALAIFVGDMVANITYYLPVILSYEIRKKLLKE